MRHSSDSGFSDLHENRLVRAGSNGSLSETSDDYYTEVQSKKALSKRKRVFCFFTCMRKPLRITGKDTVLDKGKQDKSFQKDFERYEVRPKLPSLDTLPAASRSQSSGSYCTKLDKSTQVPEVEVKLQSQNRDEEGSIQLSLTSLQTEDQLLLYCKQEQDKFATLFETYGLTLLSIEKGSIVFKFKLESQDCTWESLLAEGKLKHLVADIVNSLPELDGQESVVIEVELSSMQKVKYDIASSAVQIGDSNLVLQQGIGDTSKTSTASENKASTQNDVSKLHRSTSQDPNQVHEHSVKMPAKEVHAGTLDHNLNNLPMERFDSQLYEVALETSHNAFHKYKAYSVVEGHTVTDTSNGKASNKTKVEASEKFKGDSVAAADSGMVGMYIDAVHYDPDVCGGKKTVAKLSKNDSGYGTGMAADTGKQHDHDAIIIFRTSNTVSMQLISDELSALKTVSSLEFDTQLKSPGCEVTVLIRTPCIILNQFYDRLVAFLTYPHLLKIITSGTTNLTLKIKSDGEYQEVCTPKDEAVLIFEGHDAIGLQKVVRELENMKSVSLIALRYNTVCTDTVHKVSVHMERGHEADGEFLSRVLRFPSFYHLMSTIVQHRIDLSIGMRFKGDQSGTSCA